MNGFPAIVLVVGLHDARGKSCVAPLEEAGCWVAECDCLEYAVRDVVDLRPDVVITDLSTAAPEGHTEAVVRALKSTPATDAVPLIVLEHADAAAEPLPELGELDARLVKPVSPAALQNAVERARHAWRAVRRRHKVNRTVSVGFSKPLGLNESKPPKRTSESVRRRCPACGRPVLWAERSTVGGVEYDYFRWCKGGCGLYCLEVAKQQWLKLA